MRHAVVHVVLWRPSAILVADSLPDDVQGEVVELGPFGSTAVAMSAWIRLRELEVD
jgi:hypothetical protein